MFLTYKEMIPISKSKIVTIKKIEHYENFYIYFHCVNGELYDWKFNKKEERDYVYEKIMNFISKIRIINFEE